MAFSASMAWFRNPVTLDHLPDLVQEAFGAALVSVRATLPAAAARLLVAARLGGAEVAVVVVAAAAGNETKATAGPAALAQSQSSSPLAPVVVTFDALRLAETAMAALVFATLAWALTQPWRWLALRRWLAIYGVVALLRAVTVIVTTLPDSRAFCRQTPGTHRLDAFPWAEVLSRALEIAAGRHFETCGDLVFSGHSTVLALVGMALHSYYRVRSGSVSASPPRQPGPGTGTRRRMRASAASAPTPAAPTTSALATSPRAMRAQASAMSDCCKTPTLASTVNASGAPQCRAIAPAGFAYDQRPCGTAI
jgi:hypothetical protein